MMVEVLRRKPKFVLLALPLLAIVLLGGREAAAEVSIAGNPESMNVEAKNALLQELLSALRDKYGLSFQSTTSLDTSITGNFHGSLEQVVSSVLYSKNYSYTYQRTAGHPFVQIIGVEQSVASNAAAEPAPSPPPGQSAECANKPEKPRRSHISAKYLAANARELTWRTCTFKP